MVGLIHRIGEDAYCHSIASSWLPNPAGRASRRECIIGKASRVNSYSWNTHAAKAEFIRPFTRPSYEEQCGTMDEREAL